jgi:hypothetical protein
MSIVSPREMNPSASALSWFALIVNVLGLIVLALGMQFIFPAFAVVPTLIPTIFARKGSQIFGGLVLIMSLALAITCFPDYKSGVAEHGTRARVGDAITFLKKSRVALESACSDGTLGSKQELTDVGLIQSDPSASISRVEFSRVSPNVVRLTNMGEGWQCMAVMFHPERFRVPS